MLSDKNLKRIMDCMPIPIIILDTEDNIVLYNTKVEVWANDTLYNLTVKEFLNIYISDDDIPKCLTALQQLKDAIKEHRNESIKVEVRTKKLKQALYFVLSTASNIVLNTQDYILVTLEDITLLKYKERELKYAEELFNRAVNMGMKSTRNLANNIKADTCTFAEQQETLLKMFSNSEE